MENSWWTLPDCDLSHSELNRTWRLRALWCKTPTVFLHLPKPLLRIIKRKPVMHELSGNWLSREWSETWYGEMDDLKDGHATDRCFANVLLIPYTRVDLMSEEGVPWSNCGQWKSIYAWNLVRLETATVYFGSRLSLLRDKGTTLRRLPNPRK